MSRMLGVVVLAHGSRDPLWRAPIESVAAAIVARSPATPVACAYLEMCEPDLASAVQSLLSTGVRHIRLLPLFFGMGKHAREDLPLLVDQLRAQHPHVTFEALAPAGEDSRLGQLLAEIALESPP